MNIPKELLEKYHMNTLEGYINDFGDDGSYVFYDTFLCQTDHIPLKIIESFVEDMAAASALEILSVLLEFFKNIKITYNDVLQYRKQAREEINKLTAE